MNISVLGAGGWGTTLAILLHNNKHNVTLWEYNKEYSQTLLRHHENFYFLPGVKIPEDIDITNDLKKAVKKKDLLVISTPTQFIRKSFESLEKTDLSDSIIVNVSKGIENKTHLLVNEIISDVLKKADANKIACMSGPSHAEEVSRKVPTAVVCAANDNLAALTIQKAFSNEFFRVYTSDDVTGVELGGALKNVIAIAAGIADGAGFGDNSKAALMTRGINEIMRLGLRLGAQKETFFGLSGIGDLIVTCSSKHSRNRYVGEEIGKGRHLKEVLDEMKMVAEGVATSKAAAELAKQNKVELPIIEEVNKILFEDKPPVKATRDLMLRELKSEY